MNELIINQFKKLRCPLDLWLARSLSPTEVVSLHFVILSVSIKKISSTDHSLSGVKLFIFQSFTAKFVRVSDVLEKVLILNA